MSGFLSVAKDFRELREKLGLSQREVARRSGIEQCKLSLFEAGKIGFGLHRLRTIARVLGHRVHVKFEPWGDNGNSHSDR